MADVALQKYLFEVRATFRPGDPSTRRGCARREGRPILARHARRPGRRGPLPGRAEVGPEARGPGGRACVDAIKAISRGLNVLSSNPEPRITLEIKPSNPKMDRAWSSAVDLGTLSGFSWRLRLLQGRHALSLSLNPGSQAPVDSPEATGGVGGALDRRRRKLQKGSVASDVRMDRGDDLQ